MAGYPLLVEKSHLELLVLFGKTVAGHRDCRGRVWPGNQSLLNRLSGSLHLSDKPQGGNQRRVFGRSDSIQFQSHRRPGQQLMSNEFVTFGWGTGMSFNLGDDISVTTAPIH